MKVLSILKRIARALAYPTFFFVCFVFFCYRTFPYDRLRDFVVQEIEQPKNASGVRTPSGYDVNIIDLEPYWFSGLEMSGIEVRKPADDANPRPLSLSFPSAHARVSVLPLLLGRLAVAFVVDTPTGNIDGDVTLGFDQTLRAMDVTLTDVNLRHVSMGPLARIPLKGIASGRIDLDLSSGKADGLVDLEVRGLEIGDGETKVPIPGTVLAGGLTIDTIRAGVFQFRTQLTDGTGRVDRLTMTGRDLQVRGTGEIHVDRDPRLTRLDLMLSARFTDEYKNRSDRTRMMFQLLESNARMRQARAADGSWQLRVRGSPGGQIVPEPAGRERFPSR